MFWHLLRVTLRNLAWSSALLGSWALVVAVAPAPAAQQHPVPVDRVSLLVDRNACWTAVAPAGAEPTRAVVTLPGERPRVVRAATGFRIWLEGEPGVVHAFCP